ncbi:hypothetical protein NDU88_003159 [Pleurodeles waltl]|uniref:Uncharacterized protein n=1 Tax=Pleurodeles waltl TaxID=8319 RepID=A0AAV7MTH0_PLEWA|nr:hypothetical protein NDU88_003159 [Pleurodeles waltl]
MFVSFVGEEVGSNHETRQRDLPCAAWPGFTEGLRSAGGASSHCSPSFAGDPGCHHSNPSAGSSRARGKRRDSRRRRACTVPALCSPLLAPPLPPHGIPSARVPLRTGSPPTSDRQTLVRETRDARRWCFRCPASLPLSFLHFRFRSLVPLEIVEDL